MIPFKAVLEDPSVVIVDEHSPHKLMQGYWYFDTPFFRSGGRKFLSLLALIWRSWRSVSCPGVGALSAVPASRRSVGCPGVSGAVRRCPALSQLQTLRALQPVQSLIRVPSDKAFTRRPSLFSNPEKMSRGRRMSSLVFFAE